MWLEFRSVAQPEKDAEFSRYRCVAQIDESQEVSQVEVPPVILQRDDLRNFQMRPLVQIPCIFGERPESVLETQGRLSCSVSGRC